MVLARWKTVVKPTSNYLLQIMINAPKMGLKSLVRAYDTQAEPRLLPWQCDAMRGAALQEDEDGARRSCCQCAGY